MVAYKCALVCYILPTEYPTASKQMVLHLICCQTMNKLCSKLELKLAQYCVQNRLIQERNHNQQLNKKKNSFSMGTIATQLPQLLWKRKLALYVKPGPRLLMTEVSNFSLDIFISRLQSDISITPHNQFSNYRVYFTMCSVMKACISKIIMRHIYIL